LPVAKIAPYMEALGVGVSQTETNASSPLPQYFSDEFGWQEMVATVAGVYNALPPEERAKTGILTDNYGQAGAIDFFGSRYGLPKAISGHQNYFYWGPRNYTGESLILLGVNPGDAHTWCGSVQEGPRIEFPYTMGWEHYTILVCRDLKQPLASVWPLVKHWN
jgi:hypothetical protein